MRVPLLTVVGVFALGLYSAPALLQSRGGGSGVHGGEDETGPYDLVRNWPQPFARSGYIWGSQGGVFAESPGRIFLLNRGELKLPDKVPADFTGAWGLLGPAVDPTPEIRNCIVVVNGDGKTIESWTQWDRLFQGGHGPHSLQISPYDPERNVWVIDDWRQQIFVFSNDGKRLIRTFGQAGVEGNDEKHFGRPTAIAWLPDGSFFVADGYTNSRVMKFDKDGTFLTAWGTKGNKPGEFQVPHSIAVDRARRVFVADRANRRIQIFDQNGKFILEWTAIRSPDYLMMSADSRLWVADGVTNKFLKYSLNGSLEYAWGTYGTFPGGVWGVHQFSVDTEGNLYAAEALGGRTQKFRPKIDADAAALITPPAPLMSKAAQ
jgi:6-bladed beta-propeller protein